MRPDMGKVVIERPRRGSSGKSLKTRNVVKIRHDGEEYYHEGPLHIGSGSIRHAYNRKLREKNQTDVLGPIRGYLRSRVGKPWNDTWSEICAQLSGRSHPIEHVLGHIKSDVNVHNVQEEKWKDFVVVDGILIEKKFPSRKGKYKPLKPIDDKGYYTRINNCWFVIVFLEYKIAWETSWTFRMVVPKLRKNEITYKRVRYYFKKLRSLSKKEIRDLDQSRVIDIREYQKDRYQ